MTGMTSYAPGEVVLGSYPFVTGRQSKNRPMLVILDSGDADMLVARITSQPHTTPYDIALADWQGAGLLGPSTIRLHKLATLDKKLAIRRVGMLQPADHQSASAVLARVFGSW